MDRREILRLGLAAFPVSVWAQHHPEVPGILAQTASAKNWKPEFFNAQQNETVIILSELIIPTTDTPGAKAALVNRHMDHLLAASKPGQQAPISNGLAWMDAYAQKTGGKQFVGLRPAEQVAILEKLSTPGVEGKPAEDLVEGTRFFNVFKSFTSRIYYATEIGTEELNKGGRVPAGTGCPA